jgi:kynurenine 3-monooxygenase
MQETVIVGAGLVGSLLSIYLARAGYKVTIYERNPDRSDDRLVWDRSINLTLCERGFQALERVGIADRIRAISVPVLGRLIHNLNGTLSSQPYGNNGEAIYSVSRNRLNQVLIDCTRAYEHIKIRFNEECIGIDLPTNTLQFRNGSSGDHSNCKAHRIFAADGAFSALRYISQRRARFDFSQVFSTQAYKELTMPAAANGEWPLDPNFLHIWPRGNYMLIAFPNTNHSFTCSLHMPYEGEISHGSIRSAQEGFEFFRKSFPDTIPLMPSLAQEYAAHPPNAMVTIRCNPWVFEDKLILIGDAAHAIFPSYGQGANAGVEDCRVLIECLEKHGHNWPLALKDFQARRKPNADTIADLSDRHFIELRDLVSNPRFLLRKEVERRINRLYPEIFKDLYSMVTFTDMPYVEALRIDQQQQELVERVLAFENFDGIWHSGDADALIHEIMNAHAPAPTRMATDTSGKIRPIGHTQNLAKLAAE